MSKKNIFTLEEFIQERNINSYYEQDRIRKRAAEYKNIIETNTHFLEQLQESCTHPERDERNFCKDCGKDLNG